MATDVFFSDLCNIHPMVTLTSLYIIVIACNASTASGSNPGMTTTPASGQMGHDYNAGEWTNGT